MKKFCVFFHDQLFHTYHIYYYHTKQYAVSKEVPYELDRFEYSRLTKKKICKSLENGDTIEDILKEYAENVLKWRDELLSSKKLIRKYDFMTETSKADGTLFTNTNESNILTFFRLYSTKKFTPDKFDKITWNEYVWYEKENLASLMRSIKGTYNCIGYDFKMAYPNYLSSQVVVNGERKIFMFPMKKGKRMKIKSLKNYLDYGLYRVKIHTDSEVFQFVFNLNKANVYTHYEIDLCRKYQKLFNITIDLIIDDDYNCLIYKNSNRDTLINGEHVFKPWLDRIKDLKEEFPDNGLVKLLSSSIWGYLSKINKRYYNDKELDENPDINFDYFDSKKINYLCINEKDNADGTTDYLLINKDKPYCKNYRLKPFIKAFERTIMAEICLYMGVDKIVRINTDNITFNKDLLTEEDIIKLNSISPTFIKEEKTTGKFEIKSLNNFVKID